MFKTTNFVIRKYTDVPQTQKLLFHFETTLFKIVLGLVGVPVILLGFDLDGENFQSVSSLWKEVSHNPMGGDLGCVSLRRWSIACGNCLGGHGGPTVLWWGEGSILPLSRSRSWRSQFIPG